MFRLGSQPRWRSAVCPASFLCHCIVCGVPRKHVSCCLLTMTLRSQLPGRMTRFLNGQTLDLAICLVHETLSRELITLSRSIYMLLTNFFWKKEKTNTNDIRSNHAIYILLTTTNFLKRRDLHFGLDGQNKARYGLIWNIRSFDFPPRLFRGKICWG